VLAALLDTGSNVATLLALHERVTRWQARGMVLALAAVAMIVAG
jgi:hypothetical protein